ncbi:Mobile element protein [Candidatus Enterovibrio altilux]|uniref:Mobile element protein n=1 Tax=Candidatus Enterovibrio altilux TaxID=1927128 RepID=A0A291B7X2_9GAMM|nr:Mobile element protein [Candidatus Enterovibrio luxaltus]
MALMEHSESGASYIEGVDITIHEIITVELSASNITDGELLSNVLKQTHHRINAILSDGTYSTKQCYETVRIKRTFHSSHPKK